MRSRGATRFISEAAGKNNPALGACDHSQQWLGPAAAAAERCTEISRLLIRTASNAYFTQKLSVSRCRIVARNFTPRWERSGIAI